MGNEQIGCCNSSKFPETDNIQEEKIREELYKVSSQLKNYSTIEEIIYKTFQTTFLDIDSSPLVWITKPLYDKFINSIFNTEIEPLSKASIRTISMNYNDANISSSSYKEKFNLLLLTWLLLLYNNSKMDVKEKYAIIKKIIIKNSRIITFESFSLFIKTALELALCDITMNYAEENNTVIEFHRLVSQVYNFQNINEYHKWMCTKLKKIIIKDKPQLSTESKINNEFINDEQFGLFFEENPFVLNSLELRINFYNKYYYHCGMNDFS